MRLRREVGSWYSCRWNPFSESSCTDCPWVMAGLQGTSPAHRHMPVFCVDLLGHYSRNACYHFLAYEQREEITIFNSLKYFMIPGKHFFSYYRGQRSNKGSNWLLRSIYYILLNKTLSLSTVYHLIYNVHPLNNKSIRIL